MSALHCLFLFLYYNTISVSRPKQRKHIKPHGGFVRDKLLTLLFFYLHYCSFCYALL